MYLQSSDVVTSSIEAAHGAILPDVSGYLVTNANAVPLEVQLVASLSVRFRSLPGCNLNFENSLLSLTTITSI
jgi:hypothetical protein